MIRGDVRILLDSLGARQGDVALARAFALAAGEPEIEAFDDSDGETTTYASFVDHGVEFVLKGGEVSSVFVAASDTPDLHAYRGWSTLLPPLEATSTRADIIAVLGEPLRATAAYLTYAADAGYVQFEFGAESLTMLVVMRRLVGGAPDAPGAGTPAASESGAGSGAGSGSPTVSGDVTIFLSALGQPMFSPAHVEVIGLVGPASESRDEIIDGVAWQYEDSPRSGVLLQFRQELLVGAMISVVETGGGVYPAPDRLIDGLPLPASRERVVGFLGAPRQSRDDMDLFFVGDDYLRVDYADGESIAVTVVQAGAIV